MTSYLCVYCDAEFEYVSDREEHERTCRNHPAAVKERQRALDEVRDLLNDLETEIKQDTDNLTRHETIDMTLDAVRRRWTGAHSEVTRSDDVR